MEARMEQFLAYMQKEHLTDGMFISRPVNVKYVSHYTGEDSWLLYHGAGKILSDRSALHGAGFLWSARITQS